MKRYWLSHRCTKGMLGLSIMALASCTVADVTTGSDDELESDGTTPETEQPNEGDSGTEENGGDSSQDENPLPLVSPNILFILADDLGVDPMAAYPSASSSVIKANTPNIDKLQEQGIVFDNAWSSPLSTPTRAASITGMYGYNSGMTTLGTGLSSDIPILHASMPEEYATAVIGKWHLSKASVNPVETYGLDYFVGADTGGSIDDYYSWPLTQNFVQETCTEYVTSKLTDITIEWIAAQEGPWLCWLTHIAPHTPLHVPPADLHTRTDLPADQTSMEEGKSLPHFLAIIESMDTEIGRLLDSMDDQTRANTIVIFMGDNGTALGVVQQPYNMASAKGSLYEGGIRVPLIVSGERVVAKGERSNSLVSAPDIFATTLELAGVATSQYKDSYSYAGEIMNSGTTLRRYSFADIVRGGNPYSCAIRNECYKLIVIDGEPDKFIRIDGYSDEILADFSEENTLDSKYQEEYDELWEEIQRMNITY